MEDRSNTYAHRRGRGPFGIDVLAQGPERLGPLMQTEHAKWQAVIQKAGIKID